MAARTSSGIGPLEVRLTRNAPPSDCVASYDLEHDAVTKRYLDGKIARFLTNAENLECL